MTSPRKRDLPLWVGLVARPRRLSQDQGWQEDVEDLPGHDPQWPQTERGTRWVRQGMNGLQVSKGREVCGALIPRKRLWQATMLETIRSLIAFENGFEQLGLRRSSQESLREERGRVGPFDAGTHVKAVVGGGLERGFREHSNRQEDQMRVDVGPQRHGLVPRVLHGSLSFDTRSVFPGPTLEIPCLGTVKIRVPGLPDPERKLLLGITVMETGCRASSSERREVQATARGLIRGKPLQGVLP